jgi:hypothetical protein
MVWSKARTPDSITNDMSSGDTIPNRLCVETRTQLGHLNGKTHSV